MADLTAFYDKVKGSVGKDKAVDAISMGFSKALDWLSQCYCMQVRTLYD